MEEGRDHYLEKASGGQDPSTGGRFWSLGFGGGAGRREREEVGGFKMEGGRRRGPRRGLKGPDLGVESGRAEVWRLGVK